jgi:hypothetical protein
MKLFNTNHLTGTVLAVLACASFIGCTRAQDRSVLNTSPAIDTTQATASNMTLAADDTANEATAAPSEMPQDTSASSPTKSSKHSKAKHKAKKHSHKKMDNEAVVAPAHTNTVVSTDQDSYFYDSDSVVTNTKSVDATEDYKETTSGTTHASMDERETGLSPFAQEPNSRFPETIGSGQLTGEDKSTTIFDRPSLFQDPSALGRELIH